MITTLEGPPRAGRLKVLVPLLAGAAVAVVLGVYGNVHDPAGKGAIDLVFIRTVVLKVYLASAAAVIAIFQLLSALRLYGKISIPAVLPPWLGAVHRVTGTIAFLLVTIVAYHCPGRSASSARSRACSCTRCSAASFSARSRRR